MDAHRGPSQSEILRTLSVSEMLGGFAHEIAQPLNAIMIAAEVMQLKIERSQLSEIDKEFLVHRLNIVVSQVERASHLVEKFRSFNRMEVNRLERANGAVLFGRVYELMEQQFVGRGIRVLLERSESLPALSRNLVIIEGAIVQALAFARDAVTVIGQWHESHGMSYEKTLLVRIEGQHNVQTITLRWNQGEYPKAAHLPDPGRHGGLQIASQLLTATNNSLRVKEGSVVIMLQSLPTE